LAVGLATGFGLIVMGPPPVRDRFGVAPLMGLVSAVLVVTAVLSRSFVPALGASGIPLAQVLRIGD